MQDGTSVPEAVTEDSPFHGHFRVTPGPPCVRSVQVTDPHHRTEHMAAVNPGQFTIGTARAAGRGRA